VWLGWIYVWRNNVGDRGVVREEDERWIGGHKTPHKPEADMSSRYLARELSPCHDLAVIRRILNHHTTQTVTLFVAGRISLVSACNCPRSGTGSCAGLRESPVARPYLRRDESDFV